MDGLYAEAQTSRWWCVDLQQTCPEAKNGTPVAVSKARPQNLPPHPIAMGFWRAVAAVSPGIKPTVSPFGI